jgi:hypothetical protein
MVDQVKQEEVKLPDAETLLEGKEEEVVETKKEPSPEEQIAMDSGWVPKDQWKGDPDAWRPAKEFNERGELFNRIKDQTRQLNELKQAVNFLTEGQKNQYIAGFNEAMNKLKAQRNAALEQGDLVAAAKIDDKLDEVKEQAKEAKQAVQTAQVAPGPSDTYKSWHVRNQWYMQDKILTRVADAIGATFKEENPAATEAEMLSYVSKEIKKEYPSKFQTAPQPDGELTSNVQS